MKGEKRNRNKEPEGLKKSGAYRKSVKE